VTSAAGLSDEPGGNDSWTQPAENEKPLRNINRPVTTRDTKKRLYSSVDFDSDAQGNREPPRTKQRRGAPSDAPDKRGSHGIGGKTPRSPRHRQDELHGLYHRKETIYMMQKRGGDRGRARKSRTEKGAVGRGGEVV